MNELISPGLAQVTAMIQARPDLAQTTKDKYTRVVTAYLDQGGDLGSAEQLKHYAGDLGNAAKLQLKAVVRLWADDILQQVNAGAMPTVEAMAYADAIERRLMAINGAIKTQAAKGEKGHTWLSQAEVKKLARFCDGDDLICQRDRIVLGILVGAGLRRQELAKLNFDDIQHQPIQGRIRTVFNVAGKGAKNRVIPISDRLAANLDKWHGPTGGEGFIARSVTKSADLGQSLSVIGIFKIVARAGAAIGKPELAPHDLRRTYAQIGYEAGVPITQISKLLGHASVSTTQRYLNLELDLETTVSDFVPFD